MIAERERNMSATKIKGVTIFGRGTRSGEIGDVPGKVGNYFEMSQKTSTTLRKKREGMREEDWKHPRYLSLQVQAQD